MTGDGNRLLSDGTYAYTYDEDGNRTARFVDVDEDGVLDTGDTDITQYTWDSRHRLANVTNYATFADIAAETPTQAVTYLYDVENRWIGQTIDSNGDGVVDHQTRFIYDGNQIVLQFEKDGTGDVTGEDLSHRYLWGPAVDQALADEQVADPQAAGSVAWPLADHLGTIRDLALYDAQTGDTSIANHRTYDSFGNLKSQTNTAVDSVFGFTGRASDKATGLQNNTNRWYDSTTGQWLSKDPIGFGAKDVNAYRFCGNQPTTRIDPFGTDWLDTYANWFNGTFGSGYSKAAGNLIYKGTVGTGLISNDTLANASANQLAAVTTAVAIPAGIALFFGGEVVLGVGTFAPCAYPIFATAVGGPTMLYVELVVPAVTALWSRYPQVWSNVATNPNLYHIPEKGFEILEERIHIGQPWW